MKAWLGTLTLGLFLAAPSIGLAECPVVAPIADQTVNELSLLTFTVTASDPDGDPIQFEFDTPVPDGAAIDPNTGVFTFTPTAEQGGVYTIGVGAQDGSLVCADPLVEFFQITVYGDDGANCPVLAAIGDRTATEGQLLTFTATATDADGDPLAFSLINSPNGAAIDPYTGVFTWTPGFDHGPGAVDVTIRVSDNAVTPCTDSETIHVTVLDAGDGGNQCPVVSPIADQTVNELSLLTFTVTATDPDGDPIQFGFPGTVPEGAAIDPNTGVFTFTPTEQQGPGVYTIPVGAQDGSLMCADPLVEFFQITVNEVGGENQCPVLAPIGDKTVTEGQLLTFTATATDADAGQTLTFSLINLIPAGAAIDPSTGVFTWTPTPDQGPGASDVTIQVADNAATPCLDSEIIHVTVLDAGGGGNTPPVLDAPATQSVDEGQTLSFTVSATDADADTVDLTVDHLPFGVSFVDHGNNTATFTWTPDSQQSGSYTFVFTGNDRNGGTDTDTTVVTVNDVSGGGDHETVAELIGRYNPHRKELCFRIKQEDADFDLRGVDLETVELMFQGNTIDANRTHVAVECDDCFECDDDDDDARIGDQAAVGDDDDDDDGDDCDESECEASHLRACFSMSALHELYGDDVVAGLRDSEIHGTLSDGTPFIATLGPKHLDDKPGHGNDDDQAHRGDRGKHPLGLQVRPNPLNPKAEIRFTLAQAGHVRIALYDLRGRLVKTILDDQRSAGDHVLTWEGTSERGRVASGVYFLKVQATQGEEVQRVTVLK